MPEVINIMDVMDYKDSLSDTLHHLTAMSKGLLEEIADLAKEDPDATLESRVAEGMLSIRDVIEIIRGIDILDETPFAIRTGREIFTAHIWEEDRNYRKGQAEAPFLIESFLKKMTNVINLPRRPESVDKWLKSQEWETE